MSKYIIPEGWTPVATPWHGSQSINVLLSNGEIISDRSEWDTWKRYLLNPFMGMDSSDAYPVAWQLIEPLKEQPRPGFYVDVVPDHVELKDLRAIRCIADDSIAAFIWEGKAANLLRDIFDKLHNETYAKDGR